MVPSEKTNTYERGTYYFFDVQNWRSVAELVALLDIHIYLGAHLNFVQGDPYQVSDSLVLYLLSSRINHEKG